MEEFSLPGQCTVQNRNETDPVEELSQPMLAEINGRDLPAQRMAFNEPAQRPVGKGIDSTSFVLEDEADPGNEKAVDHGWRDEHESKQKQAVPAVSKTELTNRTAPSKASALSKLIHEGTNSLKKASGYPQKSILVTPQQKAARENISRTRKRLRHVHFKLPKKKGPGKGLRPIDPNSVFAERWLIFMVLPLSFELWAFPFRLAFGTPTDFGVLLGDCICDAVIVLDIIFMFCLTIPAYTYPNQEHDITTFCSIASFRIRKDLPSRVFPPFVYYVATAILSSSIRPKTVSAELWIWWAASLPRLITRLYRLATYFRGIETNLEVNVRALQLFKFTLIIFLSAHWVGCIFLFLSRLEDFGDATWIREYEEALPVFEVDHSNRDKRYLICLYKGFSAMSNLNYGLGLPKSKGEMVWAMLTMALQVYLNALILGTLLNFLVQKDPVQEAHKKRMHDLTVFMEAKNLPAELRDRLQKHFNFQHIKNVQYRAAASVTLPRSLEIKVADAKYKYIIDKCTDKGRTLHKCHLQFINAFLTRLKVMHVMAGEEITKKDQIPRELYFVLDGAVHVVDDENRVKRSIRNDVPDMSPIVGEVPFFLGINHPHTIRARPDGSVQLLVLTKEEASDVFATYPEEFEQINANLLARFDLGLKGEDLGTGGDREMDADTASLKKSIIASMKQRRDRRFAQLLQSAAMGDVEAVMMEARQGTDINQRNYDRRTILHMAAEDGNYKMVEMLIEQRADLNAKDRWGQTPLAEAVMNRQGLVAGLLTSHKAVPDIDNPAAVLCQFAYEANLEQVRRLIENGINPNLRDIDGRTALHVGAAEGRHKIVEYLLAQGAEVNALDRFGSTPLQNAVQNSKILAVNILRSNGATMPPSVGPGEMFKAAISGDVNRLRLLHDCAVDIDCIDYDSRTPLHIAASKARLLAVSFLLGVSANPNLTNRWGGRPLDDALEGWTLYHKYCAKMIHGWGGKLGRLAGTEEGERKMKELEEIEVDDIRAIVKRLIAHGQNAPMTRLSVQELRTQREATIEVIQVVQELREMMDDATDVVQQTCMTLKQDVGGVCGAVAHLMSALSTPVPRFSTLRMGATAGFSGSLRNVLGWRTDGPVTQVSNIAVSSIPKLGQEPVIGQQSHLVTEIAERLEELEGSEDELDETEVEGDGGAEGGIDSEEEEMLHAEIDALLRVQEMAMVSHSTPEAMAAKQFQEIALKVVQFEDAFEALAAVCVSVRIGELRGRAGGGRVPKRATAGWMGKVTLEGLPQLLSMMRVDSSMLDMETIYDQACSFARTNPDLDRTRGGPGWGKLRTTVNTLSMLKRSSSSRGVGGDGFSRSGTVSLEALLAGSSLFRKAVLAMRTDANLCAVMDTWIGRILGEENARKLLAGSQERTVKQGWLVFDASTSSDLCIIVAGEVAVEQKRAMSMLSSPNATPRNQVLVKGDFIGAYGALGLAYIPGLSATASRPCTLIAVQAEHASAVLQELPAVRLELISKAGEAPVVLPEEPEVPSLPETKSRVGMLARMGNSAKNVLERKQSQHSTITEMMRNAKRKISVLVSPRPQPVDRRPVPEAEVKWKELGEIERWWIRDMVDSALSMWGLLSMGQPTVTRGHLLAVGSYLGEVSSECFRKMFLADRANMPQEIDQAFFWRCWIAFVSSEVFGEQEQEERRMSLTAVDGSEHGAGEGGKAESDGKANNASEAKDDDEEASEDGSETFLGRLQHRFTSVRSVRKHLFEEDVMDMYETAYRAVVGNLQTPMPENRVAEFLMRVFVDFPFKISKQNVEEFLNVFLPNRNQAIKATVTWGDIRKVVRKHRLGLTADAADRATFIGTVFNPNATWMRYWYYLIKACAAYYSVAVPMRAAFLPWDSMLNPTALGMELPADVICFLHTVVMFNTAYQNSRSTWVTRRIKILNKVNWASAFAAIPLDWFAFISGASNEACCWLRVNKMLLLITWSGWGWMGFARLRTGPSKVWHTMLYMALTTLHLAACFWFFLGARFKHWHPTQAISWLKVDDAFANMTYSREEHFGLHTDATTGEQYMLALYWVSATLTVNGLVGDVIPQNYEEILFAILLMALNMTLIRWIVGEVSALVMGADKKVIEARRELEAVDQFVTGNNLPSKLQKQIKTHFRASSAQGQGSSAVDQEALLNGMSHALKVEVASFISREYLDGVELFAGCSERLLDELSVLLLEGSFAAEEFLFRSSSAAREMYFVVSGSIDEVVEDGEEEVVEATKRAHSSVGGVAFFFGLRHFHSARASKLTGTTCLRVLREPFFELLKIYPADEETIGNNAMASLEVVETRGKSGSSRRSGSRRGGSSVVSKDVQSAEDAESRKSDGDGEAGKEGGEDEQDLGSTSGYGEDGEASDALEALVGSTMKDKITALKSRRRRQRVGLLMHAAAEGDVDKCSRLVRGDLPVNSSDSNKRTALHVASSEGHLKLVKLLVDLRADVHLKDKFANTPFNDAVRHQHDRVVLFLRDTHPEIRMTLPGFKGAVLMCDAASKGDLPQIQRLVENGVSVNDGNYDRRTALHVAASEGHLDVCKYLLAAKAAPRCRDRFQGTPLVDAVREEQEAVQQLMRDHGGNLGVGHGARYAAELCQSAHEGELGKVKTMLLNGVDAMEGDYNHRTCLHLAACSGQISVLEHLLRNTESLRIDVNRVDQLGHTALDDAVRHDNEPAACVLRQAGGLQAGAGAAYDGLVSSQRQERAMVAKEQRKSKVRDVVKHCPERRAKDSVQEQLLPSLRRACKSVSDELSEMERALTGLTSLVDKPVRTGSSRGPSPLSLNAERTGSDGDKTAEEAKSDGPNVEDKRDEVVVVRRASAMDFASVQEGAERVMKQVKKVRQAAGELRRVLEFGTAGTVEGIDCTLWKRLQHSYFLEGKGAVRQLRKADEVGRMVGRLMKEMVRAAKKRARSSAAGRSTRHSNGR